MEAKGSNFDEEGGEVVKGGVYKVKEGVSRDSL